MSIFKSLKNLFSDNKIEVKDEIKLTETEDPLTEVIEKEEDNEAVERMHFEVKGTFIDEKQKLIKDLITKIKKEDEDFGYSEYSDFTNAEIKESLGEKIYQYEDEDLYIARLEEEPTNEYDENAIKVNIVDKEGKEYFIGYVPKEMTLDIKELISKYSYNAATGIKGGKYKKQDWNVDDKEIIKTGSDDYKIEIYLSVWKDLPEFMKERLSDRGIDY